MRRSLKGSSERGAIAVEFALVLPILLAVLFGLVQYGFYFWSMQGGSAAAREAARQAAVGKLVDCDDFADYVRDRIGITSSDAPDADITRNYEKLNEATGDWVGFTPSSPGNEVMVGDLVTVSVTFQSYDLNFPFVPFIDGGVVSQTADSRVEYVPDASIGECP